MSSPTLPPILSLATADEQTIKSALDTLFEPSAEIHALAIPLVRNSNSQGEGEGESSSRVAANPGISPDIPVPVSISGPGRFRATTVPAEVPPSPSSTSYGSLIDAIGDAIKSLIPSSSESEIERKREKLHNILGSHPRLGAKKVESAQSRAEQARLQQESAGSGEAEVEKLASLNREYEARFPGLRYVVFVNGRGRDVIMQDMRRRIDRGDISAEEREGVQAMIDIAHDRAKKLESAASAASAAS
ncbi:OHCU decarboxylase-domain-containing protein [Xylariaceae sp. FL0594]|nr:OHCU decarboxylase-domain-containing protein [Xylariaceae sp. FL0594]